MKARLWIAVVAIVTLGIPGTYAGRFLDRGDIEAAPTTAHDSLSDSGLVYERDRVAQNFCSQTTGLMFRSCGAELRDDYFSAQAKCVQVLDPDERADCFATADEERREAIELCGDQRAARNDLCGQIGEDRYDPNWDPALFVTDYDNIVPNPYYPLVIGYRWSFRAADESNVIENLPKTKFIEGVNCLVINDLVTAENGGEDTDDWYAQRHDGTVDYCGEEVQDYEMFEGDNPVEPEVVAIDGSFKHGRDGDLAGTIMPGSPFVGQVYRQEMSLGNAEDSATILTTTYDYGELDGLDEHAPQELVDLLCNDDCLVTGEFTPVEPDLFDLKFYAYGIGLFLEVNPESGEINQLVDCNFDPRCNDLPQP